MAMNPGEEIGARLLAMADPERFIQEREVNVQNDIEAIS